MANIIEPDMILAHFLRSQLNEIIRTDSSTYPVKISTDSQNFSGDDSTTEFTLTNQPESITSVTIGGTTVYPFTHYNIDLDNKKITFLTPPATGTDNITVNYKKGTSWIYPDLPRSDLTKNSYPRVGVMILSENRDIEATSEDNTYDTITFQIDCVTTKDLACTIDGETLYDQDIADYLSRQVLSVLKNNWRDKLSGKLFGPVIINRSTVPFDESLNTYRKIIEVSYSGFNICE